MITRLAARRTRSVFGWNAKDFPAARSMPTSLSLSPTASTCRALISKRFTRKRRRLAHAHEHDVEGRVEQARRPCQHAHLRGDFARRQMAHEAHLAGQAEGAPHRAADLRRDAEGLRRRVGNEDALDLAPIGEGQHELAGAVFRHVLPHDRRRREWQLGGERGPQVAAEVAHLVVTGRAALPDPGEDLLRAEAGQATRDDPRLEVGEAQFGEVGRGVALHGYLTRFLRLARTSSVASGAVAAPAAAHACAAWVCMI